MTDEPTVTWRKSSRSDGQGNCVEIGFYSTGLIGIRDTKDHGRGPILTFTPAEFDAFRHGVKYGEFG